MEGKIISVFGAGGSGKSTVAVNLAAVLGAKKIVIVFSPRLDYPSIQSFYNIDIPEKKSLQKLYEDISTDKTYDVRDTLVQYPKNKNIFMLGIPDNTTYLTLADAKILPDRSQCESILVALKSICDYLIVDCVPDITNRMSSWALNYADTMVHVIRPTQQGLRFVNSVYEYVNIAGPKRVINVANADKGYIGLAAFEEAAEHRVHFDIALPYDEQVECSESEGQPILENYTQSKFGSHKNSYAGSFMKLVSMITG